MTDTIRYIIAGALILLIIVLQPVYMKWLGYDTSQPDLEQTSQAQTINPATEETKKYIPAIPSQEDFSLPNDALETFITISTPLYTTTLSNRSGGSIEDYTLTGENSGKLNTSEDMMIMASSKAVCLFLLYCLPLITATPV